MSRPKVIRIKVGNYQDPLRPRFGECLALAVAALYFLAHIVAWMVRQ